jgi:sugar O-acyltransferase (sialic acid O-acetyltransferase NeuD family)
MASPAALVLFGASGHAKVVIDIVEREGRHRIVHLVDDNAALHGKTDAFLAAATGKRARVLVSIGDNAVRARIAARLRAAGFELARAVHPGAQVGRGAKIGAGTVVMAGAVVNPDAAIGENVIINSGATVDHDCVIGDGAHIAPGVRLCGGVRVGAGTLVGAGSVAIPGIRIGANVVVRAGSVLTQDLAR